MTTKIVTFFKDYRAIIQPLAWHRRSLITPRQKNIGLREVQADDILWNTLYTDESSLNSRFIKGEVILYMKIAMGRIPKDQRNLLILRFNEERDLRWIAKKLRISERQVRRRVQNALESLKMEFHNA